MAHSKIQAPSLGLAFIIVAITLVGGSIVSQIFTASNTPPELTAQETPLPTQTLNKGGHKSTVLSFTPTSSVTEPIIKSMGEEVSLDLIIDPGQNLVSFIKLDITYDPVKLTPVKDEAFRPVGALSSILDGPIYTRGKISVTMSVGADPTRALGKPEHAGIVRFRTIAPTIEGDPTLVSFGSSTNILSLASGDSASENVLSNTIPAAIQIVRR